MAEFLIGLAATLTGAIIAYIFRENIENIINSIFKNIYAKIEGEWEIHGYWEEKDGFLDMDEEDFLEMLNADEELSEEDKEEILNTKKEHDERVIPKEISDRELIQQLKQDDYHTILKVKQVANKVSGEINTIIKGSVRRVQKVNGKITPSRIVIINTEDKSEGHHNFGTYLLKLNSTTDIMKGFETYLCSECEDTAYANVILNKMKK